MKALLNYAEWRFKLSQLKLSVSGLQLGFDTIFQMGKENISKEFYERNEKILSCSKGAGYWLWKPYFIGKCLSNMTPDDILFYMDSGMVIIKDVSPLFDKIKQDAKGIACFHLPGNHLEKNYNKQRLLNHMNMNMQAYTETPQRSASFVLARGTDYARELVQEYVELCSNYEVINDDLDNEIDGFIDHRHDQAEWSLLSKRENILMLPDISQWGVSHGTIGPDEQYLLHHRNPE